MEGSSGGASSSPGIFTQLTPTSQRTYNRYFGPGHEILTSPVIISNAELSLLSKEIIQIKSQFQTDTDIIEQAETLSKSIQQLSNNRSQIPDNQNIKEKKKIDFRYPQYSLGPFLVIIESTEQNLGKIHPMNLGKKLHQKGINGIKNISKKGKKRIAIEFTSAKAANQFISQDGLGDPNHEIYIPSRLIASRGVIKDVGNDISEEDVLQADSKVKILGAKRLNRRTVIEKEIKYIPSNTWVLTFEGKMLPNKIAIWGCIRDVTLYVGPVIQCYKCLRYGHTEKNCNGQKKCRNCAEKHDEKECNNSNNPKCIYCESKHSSTDRTCPEFFRQKKINEIIATENISYFEASKIMKKDYISPQLQPQSYPPLNREKSNNSIEESNLISVANRRLLIEKPNISSSYNSIAKKRRTSLPKTIGYDKAAHNNLLIENSSHKFDPSTILLNQNSNINSNLNIILNSLDRDSVSKTEFLKLIELVEYLKGYYNVIESPNMSDEVSMDTTNMDSGDQS
ncbi:hypothetical protein WA026_020115 [Henosepilachna vigintioctopunctata]|uniref:CCHC-type domain-containing protein n=1 Tax=Henosepilachna vigintioctopunctata TaxID=420089 RepID=A0AAW1UF29_9CUCU